MTTTTIAGFATTTKRLTHAELRQLHVHRFAGIFRPVEGDEHARLLDSMRRRFDESQPIVCWAQTGEIVDGRNRRDLAVCVLKLASAPVAFVEFPDENAVRDYVIAANLARRQLTTRELGELAGRLVLNGASTRSAAKTAGVSKATAQRAATKARSSGVSDETPAKKRTNGADGKSYPATRRQLRRADTPLKELLDPLDKYLRGWDETRLRGTSPADARRLLDKVQRVNRGLTEVAINLESRTVVSRALK